jgi:hypothetical protein
MRQKITDKINENEHKMLSTHIRRPRRQQRKTFDRKFKKIACT